jgi:hypothetical protein
LLLAFRCGFILQNKILSSFCSRFFAFHTVGVCGCAISHHHSQNKRWIARSR